MFLGISPALGPRCLTAEKGFGVGLGERGALVPTLAVPPPGFHLAWLKSPFRSLAGPGAEGGRLLALASAICQLSWLNRWLGLRRRSRALGTCGSDAENRQEHTQGPTFAMHTRLCVHMARLTRIFCFM